MAIQVERLIATLEARIDKYEKSLAKAQGVTNQQFTKIEQRGKLMESRLSKLGVNVFAGFARGALTALAPILSVAVAVRGAKDAMKEFGDVADNAKAAGLDAEFFQSLAHQAQLGGVEIGEISGALATFAKNSGLAAEGKGRMTTALKALDPVLLENIRNAATQEQRIKLVADALSKETDASRKAAIATAAFGDAGGKLAGVFAGGSSEIDVMMVKAKEAGLIVDRDLIARADELGDKFDTTTKIVDLQLKQALINLGPILVWLSGLAGDVASQIGHTVDGLKAIGDQQSSTLEMRLKGIDTQEAGVNDAMAAGIDPAAAAAERAAIMEELRKRAIDNLRNQLTTRPPDTGNVPTLDELATRDEAAKAAIRQAEAVKALIDNLEFERTTIGLSERDLARVNALRQAGSSATEEQRAKIAELTGALYDEREAADRSAEAQKALTDTLRDLGQIGVSAATALVDALDDGKVSAEEFNSILGDVLKSVLDIGANLLLSSLTGGSGGLNLFGHRAAGGPVSAGQPYVVGEKRPELFVPNTAGRIVPRVPRSGGGMPSIIVNIDARGAQAGVAEQIGAQFDQWSRFVLPTQIRKYIADPMARG